MNKRPFSKSLHGKLTLQTLIVGLVPVVIVGLIAYQSLSELTETADERLEQSRLELSRDVVGVNLSATASRVAQQIDVFMRERILDAIVWARAPNVVEAAKGAAAEHSKRGLETATISEVEDQFRSVKSLNLFPGTSAYLKDQIALSPHFGEVFFTDQNGFNVAMTNPTSDFVQRDEAWWRQAWNNGLDIGDVEFDDSAGIWSVDVSVRIADPETGTRLGVMKSVLGVSLIQEVATTGAAEINGGRVTVANRDGLLLAETSSQHSRERIMNDEFNLRSSGDADIVSAFTSRDKGYVLGAERVLGFARLDSGGYGNLVPNFEGFDWLVLVEQPTSIAYAPIRGLSVVQEGLESSKQVIVVVLLTAVFLVALISMALANVMSRKITVPLFKLRELADRVSKGDTSKTIEVKSDDEIKDLAIAFERMRKSISIAMRKIRESRTKSAA
ncbi:MAG: HAMP domain-containing protein [Gammaproteobacteria bacterium]|nr:HAMP domain-containing protein [Gammaproteobacteria bacterium]